MPSLGNHLTHIKISFKLDSRQNIYHTLRGIVTPRRVIHQYHINSPTSYVIHNMHINKTSTHIKHMHNGSQHIIIQEVLSFMSSIIEIAKTRALDSLRLVSCGALKHYHGEIKELTIHIHHIL